MGTRLIGRYAIEIGRRTRAKRSARRRQENSSNPRRLWQTRVVRREALEDGIVLAVDRQERCAAVANGRHEQLTADDERFLVGEQNPLAGARCRERRTEARRTDN